MEKDGITKIIKRFVVPATIAATLGRADIRMVNGQEIPSEPDDSNTVVLNTRGNVFDNSELTPETPLPTQETIPGSVAIYLDSYESASFNTRSSLTIESNIAPEIQSNPQRVTIAMSSEIAGNYAGTDRFFGNIRPSYIEIFTTAEVVSVNRGTGGSFTDFDTAPGFMLNGVIKELSSEETIAMGAEQSLWHLYNKQVVDGLIPGEEISLEDFMANRSNEDFPRLTIFGYNGEFSIPADAEIVYRFVGVDRNQFPIQQGVIKTQWGTNVVLQGEGEDQLVIDIYPVLEEFEKQAYDPVNGEAFGAEMWYGFPDNLIAANQMKIATLTLPYQDQEGIQLNPNYYPAVYNPSDQLLADPAYTWPYIRDQFADLSGTDAGFYRHEPQIFQIQ